MIRSARWASLLLLPAMMLWTGCASSRPTVARLAASPTVEPCGAVVEGVDVRAWRQIQAEGFTFCAPASWSRNARHDRTTARRATGVASVSWAAPDTAHRVIFAVAVEDRAIERARTFYTSCQHSSRGAHRVGEQDVCVLQYTPSANPPACPNAWVDVPTTDRRFPIRDSAICPAGVPRNWAGGYLQIVYGQPLVSATAYGSAEAHAVAQTVRLASVSEADRK